MNYIKYFLIFVPVSIILSIVKVNENLLFLAICLAIVPLAGIIGSATEQVSIYTGSKIGGLISATMSNIPELLIGFFAVKAGFYNLVLASMAGSIIGNILLVLGLSILLGGMKQKQQVFNKNIARSNFILLFYAAASLIIPFALQYAIHKKGDANLQEGLAAISFSLALIFLIVYISGLIFSLITHKNIFVKHTEQEEEKETAKWSLTKAILVLIIAAIFVAFESELLVDTIEHLIKSYRISEIFIGIILVPILGNVAENISAVIMAVKNKVDISIEIAIGSSIQISLFVAPLLILASFILGRPMIYVYDMFELVAMLIAIGLSLYVFQDGKTNWLEGLVLVSCYVILGVAFFFI